MMNSVTLIGRLGKDPEVRYLEGGVAVANFTMVTSEYWKDKNSGEKKEEAQWHRIILWRGLAEVAEKYLKKGALICIVGKVTYNSWEDTDGNTKYSTEIVGNEMKMLGKNEESDQSAAPAPSSKPVPSSDEEDDDLPF